VRGWFIKNGQEAIANGEIESQFHHTERAEGDGSQEVKPHYAKTDIPGR
jgi:hypothetical protein